MSAFVLVHGAWHGGWCWNKVASVLEGRGHSVFAPDLPGHGNDKTPLPAVSLDAYVERVCGILDTQSEPVVLVGHSMGGLVITQTAERRPAAIDTLVYLAAALLPDGGSLMSLMSEADEDALLPVNITPSEDGLSFTINEAIVKPAFYADCDDEDVAWAKQKLVPQAAAPFADALKVSEDGFGGVRRVYIECLQDRAIPLALQRAMYESIPCSSVISMDTSHSPFLSAPEALASHLEAIARREL